MIKNLPANAGDAGDEFDPWVWKILRRGKWKPTPVFLLGKSHGRRSLAGYSPRGCKESDMTDGADTHTHIYTRCGYSLVIIQLTSSTWWGFSIYKTAHRIWLRILCVALEKQP